MRLLLHKQLHNRERAALACWTQFLPMSRRTAHAVVEADLRQHALEVFDLHARSEMLAAASAERAFTLLTGVLIQLHAELRRSLEDVEELPEREIQQPRDHRNRVRDC